MNSAFQSIKRGLQEAIEDSDLRALVQRLRDLRKGLQSLWPGEIAAISEEAAQTIDSLLARAEAAEANVDALLDRADAAEAECARLRQDAERYRHIRSCFRIGIHGEWVALVDEPHGLLDETKFDAAIDRAIAEGKHEA